MAASTTETRGVGGAILLMALEPRSYREAIGATVATHRPALSVLIVDPENLVEQTARFRPRLVLCSRRKHPVVPATTEWIEYYFPVEGKPTVLVNGRSEETPDPNLEHMLALIDRSLSAATHPTPRADRDPSSSIGEAPPEELDAIATLPYFRQSAL